jgi:dipeptidyl aminopeptidase/acylaminoacyl peptidase
VNLHALPDGMLLRGKPQAPFQAPTLYHPFCSVLAASYGDFPHELLIVPPKAETGQLWMGSPPWIEPMRYVRNSPIFQADRVRTPLLIIQGDEDYVPIQQGEEFFTALYRHGKRARFVRYWGEGHVLESPANIRDLWAQIYRWLEENGVK